MSISLSQLRDRINDIIKDSLLQVCGETGASYTYRQVADLSFCVASGLAKLGVKKGDVLGIFCPNLPEFALFTLGALRVGACVMTVNPAYTVCK